MRLLQTLLVLTFLIIALVGGQNDEFDETTELINLNDDSFEHLTQASTGATTGDWLVLMTKDKKCSECEKIEKELKNVATLKKGFMNVAKLVTKLSPITLRRFGVSKKPILIYFHLGMQWTYKGDMKKDKIIDFISGDFAQQNGRRVVSPLDSIDIWKEDFMKELEAAYKEKRLPKNNVLLILSVGLLAGLMVVLGFITSKNKDLKKKDD